MNKKNVYQSPSCKVYELPEPRRLLAESNRGLGSPSSYKKGNDPLLDEPEP